MAFRDRVRPAPGPALAAVGLATLWALAPENEAAILLRAGIALVLCAVAIAALTSDASRKE